METQNSLISIIVPVYNVQKHLPSCIESILSQTYTYFELILIDDGSTDNSGRICDEYAEKDKRIKVIHQSNQGVSSARQIGLDTANGEYTINADPDDWIEAEMLEKLICFASENNADMVICDYWIEDNKGIHYCSQNLETGLTSENIIRNLLRQKLHGSCWNKLIKSVYSKKIKFTPKEMTCCEDELYNIRLLYTYPDLKIVYLPNAFYHYITYGNSLSHKVSRSMFKSRYTEVNELDKLLPEKFSEDIYPLRIAVLFLAFELKDFNSLTQLYPEARNQIIEYGTPYSWFRPNASCLSIALRGFPRLALIIYHFHMSTIKLKYIVDILFRHKQRKYENTKQ